MAKTTTGYFKACRVTVILYVFFTAVAVTARVLPLHPISDGKQKPIAKLYDTSKYGILQLGNGLANTPQMGYQIFTFHLFAFFIFFKS